MIRDFEMSAYRIGYLMGRKDEAIERREELGAIEARIVAIQETGEVPALERKRAEEFFAENPLATGRDGRI
jgi:hypothetical protein